MAANSKKQNGRSDSRAKVASVEERVQRIMDLMIEQAWSRPLARELAEEWGCALSTVWSYSAEASRRVVNAHTDEQKRASWERKLDDRTEEPGAAGVAALKLQGQAYGWIKDQHEVLVEMRGQVPRPDEHDAIAQRMVTDQYMGPAILRALRQLQPAELRALLPVDTTGEETK